MVRSTGAWVAIGLVACGGSTAPEPRAEQVPPAEGPAPALFLATARFEQAPGQPVTLLPARVLIRGLDGSDRGFIEDPQSNVFHKAVPWRGGLLTIGAEKARVVHWTRPSPAAAPAPTVLWETSFGGNFDRIRDLEEGDVDGDGVPELVVATHDQGVVAVGDEVGGAWVWTEVSRAPSTFVHEIELGDLDGDGTPEIFATPSEPNAANGPSQPGSVIRLVKGPSGYVQETVVAWADTHAKEILVADLGEGQALFALREGRRGAGDALIEPATVVRLERAESGFREVVVAPLPGESQARFLLAGDLDKDGVVELVATGMETGVWRLDRRDGVWGATQVDSSSGGFEQAAHLADLTGDGVLELYVASEKAGRPRELRRYTWGPGGALQREVLATIEGQGLVWGIGGGVW